MEENRKKKEKQAFSMFGQHMVYPLQIHDDISKFQENTDQLQSHQIKKVYNLDQLTIKKSSLNSKRQPKELQKVQVKESLKQTSSLFGNYRIFPVQVKKQNNKLQEKPSNQQHQSQITFQTHEKNKNQDQRSENVIRFRNNFVQSNEVSTQSSSKIGKYLKCVLASVIILAILSILGLLIFLLIYFLVPNNDNPEEPHPSNFHNVQPRKQSPYILLPDYKKDQVYHINYTVINTMSEDYKVRVNYTVYFITAKIQQKNGERVRTNFQASMQKRSQEKIARDDTIEEVQFFDNSTSYNQILKNGLSNLEGQENSTDQSENVTCQQLQSYSNQSIICNQPLLWVFNFSLLANGKIKELTFPFKIKKEELGLLRTFIKMFSPLLDKKAYESVQPRQQIKKLQQNPVLSDENQSGNSYQQISQYQQEKSQDNITLKENTEVNVQSDTQNTQQTATQSTIFQAGQPSAGSLQSQVSFLPKIQENQASDNLFDPKPTELNLNFTSNQQCFFQVIQIFTTNHLEEFSGILANYKEENKTKTTDVQGLIDFILQGSAQTQGSQIAPGTTRILLEEDGSLKIIGYDKKITLVKTNVIGFSIAAYGYFQLGIKMYQDEKNSLKKNIIFSSDIGTILSLGSSPFKFSLYQYRKQLAALNLQFTLEQIQFAYDLLKGGFIVKLIQLKNVIFSGRLEDDLLPKIGQILSVVSNLTTIVDYQANLNSPLSKLNQIYSVIQLVWETYQNKGLSLLGKDNQKIKALSSGLLQYVNVSYEQALNIFQDSKGKLDKIKSNSNTLFLSILDAFLNQTLKQVQTQIINMITQQIYDEYNLEIQKVKIIFEMMDYYRSETGKYANNITEVIEQHKKNLLDTIKNVLDLYFQNQTTTAQNIEGEFLRYYQRQKQSYQIYTPKLKNISYFVTKNSLELFNSVLNTNLGLQQYQTNFTNLFTSLTNYANGARSQRFTDCCDQYRNFWGQSRCRYYNDGQPYQNNIPTIWDATNKITNESIINATIATQIFVRNITKLLQENFTVEQKFMKLQILYYDSIGRYPLNRNLIFDALSKCKSQAQNALKNVRCGATNSLRNFINMIGLLQSAFSSYYQQYDGLNQTIFRVFDQFNTTIFTNITTYAKLTVSTVDFMKQIQEQVQIVKNGFLGLEEKTKSVTPENFVKNNDNINLQHVPVFDQQGRLDMQKKSFSNTSNQWYSIPRSIAIKGALIGSFFFGLGKLIMFFCFGILFYLGAVFVRNYYDDQYDGTNRMFTALYCLLFAGIIIGNNLSNMPEFALGYNAAANLFFIIDSKDQDQLQIQSNSKQLKTGIQGNILLNDIGFKYQSRDQELFKKLNLKIKDGEKVAFVGASGCGKSTIMQLLLRFYDVKSGEILINGKNIQDYDIHYLRSCFGVVSQEPVLFNTSFKNNIRYNIEATDLEIQEAARKANALSFIVGEEKINDYQTEQTAGKNGFDRGVGVKGSHISGGQKQRVAIARAILRNPKILLLDQATSALDSTNEQIVQLSLDTMMHGKTTISIAHRIQTVKNSDIIYVFERGLIAQTGKYEDLVAQKGKFYRLQKGIEFV